MKKKQISSKVLVCFAHKLREKYLKNAGGRREIYIVFFLLIKELFRDIMKEKKEAADSI